MKKKALHRGVNTVRFHLYEIHKLENYFMVQEQLWLPLAVQRLEGMTRESSKKTEIFCILIGSESVHVNIITNKTIENNRRRSVKSTKVRTNKNFKMLIAAEGEMRIRCTHTHTHTHTHYCLHLISFKLSIIKIFFRGT